MSCVTPTPDLAATLAKARDLGSFKRASRTLKRAIAAGDVAGELRRIHVLSSFLAEICADLLPVLLYRRGIVAEVTVGPYGGIATEILSDGAGLSARNDCLVILPTHRDAAHAPAPGATRDAAAEAAAREADDWCALWDRLQVPVVQLTLDPPPLRPMAELDGLSPGGVLHHIRATNARMAQSAPGHVALVDAEALAARIGPAWHDAALYALCKQPFAGEALREIAEALAASIAGQLGKARKVLVLDCDNTLWGGVIGDAGMDGITIGNETAEGEAFVALQAYAKALAGRGVILAVCTKNNEAIAREPFRDHPGMVLREDDIACFVANFEDKAGNLRTIAETLGVGLDSLVFVDDNPVERALVAQHCPEVMVIDLPEDPAGYCAALEAARPFPLSRVTSEDLARNQSYKARGETLALRGAAADLDSFLAGLEPRAIVEQVSPGSVERMAQLIGKTNQFKLNPTLFSVAELEALAPGVVALAFADRMQNYGICAVAVTRLRGQSLHIANWVMSCRVFSRRLEMATMEIIRTRAAALGASEITLDYVASAKNGLLGGLLAGLGFVEGEAAADGTTRLVAPVVPGVALPPHFITIEHRGAAQ